MGVDRWGNNNGNNVIFEWRYIYSYEYVVRARTSTVHVRVGVDIKWRSYWVWGGMLCILVGLLLPSAPPGTDLSTNQPVGTGVDDTTGIYRAPFSFFSPSLPWFDLWMYIILLFYTPLTWHICIDVTYDDNPHYSNAPPSRANDGDKRNSYPYQYHSPIYGRGSQEWWRVRLRGFTTNPQIAFVARDCCHDPSNNGQDYYFYIGVKNDWRKATMCKRLEYVHFRFSPQPTTQAKPTK